MKKQADVPCPLSGEKNEGCPGLVADYVIIWIKKPLIKNEKLTKDMYSFLLSKQNIKAPLIQDMYDFLDTWILR